MGGWCFDASASYLSRTQTKWVKPQELYTRKGRDNIGVEVARQGGLKSNCPRYLPLCIFLFLFLFFSSLAVSANIGTWVTGSKYSVLSRSPKVPNAGTLLQVSAELDPDPRPPVL